MVNEKDTITYFLYIFFLILQQFVSFNKHKLPSGDKDKVFVTTHFLNVLSTTYISRYGR